MRGQSLRSKSSASDLQSDGKGISGRQMAEPAGEDRKDVPVLEHLRESYLVERALSEQGLHLFDYMPDAVVIVGNDGRIRLVNKQAIVQFGYVEEELLGQPIELLVPKRLRNMHTHRRNSYFANPSVRSMGGKFRLYGARKDKSEFPVDIMLSPMPSGKEQLIISVIRDSSEQTALNLALEQEVRERTRAEEKVRELSMTDPVTGLANRTKLHQKLVTGLSAIDGENHGIGVMFLDLDKFKQVNDTWGHPTGDAVLKIFAERLRSVCRSNDTVARLGGDEFVVALSYRGEPERILEVAERLLKVLCEPIVVDDITIPTGISIGIAITTDSNTDPNLLIENADLALYHAKEAGGGQYRIFDEELGARIRSAKEQELAFDQSWERGELEILYQPKVVVIDGALHGYEALLRWNHPEKGQLSPSEFIHVAERSGQIIPITYWMLGKVLDQISVWKKAGLSTCNVAVNVAPKVFECPSFFQEISYITKNSDVDPSCLTFEITEETPLQVPDGFAEQIDKVRQLGIRISIDDFGTGYSSIANLRKFQFDEIKIDKVFVDHIHTDERDAAICRSLIRLGHNLDALVVAEGVESQAQFDFLQANGCDEAQGFLLSRPLPASEALRFGLATDDKSSKVATA